jgi:hypothetical protein
MTTVAAFRRETGTAATVWAPPRETMPAWVGAFLAVLASRLVLILLPPAGRLYNVDEQHLAFAVIDRFLGVPSTTLVWPAQPLQLLAAPLVGMWAVAPCVAHRGAQALLDCAVVRFGAAYVHVYGIVVLLRIVSAIAGSLIPLIGYALARELDVDRRIAVASAIALAVMPGLWQHSAMAAGDATSVALGLAAVWCGMRRPDAKAAIIAGVLAGAAVATKVTAFGLCAASMFVVFVGGESWTQRLARGGAWIAAAAVSLLVFCPQIWTDPTRFAKATGGAFLRPPDPEWTFSFHTLGYLTGPALWMLLVLALAGAVDLAVRSKRRPLGIALLGGIAIMALPLFGTGIVYPRYLLPLTVLLIVLAARGAQALAGALQAPLRIRVAVGLTGVLAIAFAARAVADERQLRRPTGMLTGIDRALASNAETVYLPEGAIYTSFNRLSRRTCARIARIAEERRQSPAEATSYIESRGVSDGSLRVLRAAFMEREIELAARYAAMELAAPDDPRDMFFYTESETPSRMADLEFTRNGAVAAFAAGRSSAILLVRDDIRELGAAQDLGDGWFLYRRP